MRRFGVIAAVLLGLTIAGLTGPVQAAGGPPTITSVTPNPVGADDILTVVGDGCDPNSPISFYVWQTAGGGHGYWHSTNTGYVADGAGAFTKNLGFAEPFVPDPGSQLGITVACTATFDPADTTHASAPKFVMVTLTSPTVDVAVPATVSYGAPVRVTVTPTRASGTVTLKLDGATVDTRGSAWGAYQVTLPGTPALGTHRLDAVFAPLVAGAPTATDTATFTVTKARATVKLQAAKKKIKKGNKVALTIRLTATGPLTGKVQLLEKGELRKTVSLPASGVKQLKLKMKTPGKRKLTAVFAGNDYVAAATSGRVRVKVTRG